MILARKTRATTPSFLAHFAAQAFLDSLAEFQDTAGWFPVAIVGALDEQGPAVVVGENG